MPCPSESQISCKNLIAYLNSKFQLSRTNGSRVIEKGCGSTFEVCHSLPFRHSLPFFTKLLGAILAVFTYELSFFTSELFILYHSVPFRHSLPFFTILCLLGILYHSLPFFTIVTAMSYSNHSLPFCSF